MSSEDYASIIRQIRKLVISGCPTQFIPNSGGIDVLLKEVYNFSDIERKNSRLKNDPDKKVGMIEVLLSEIDLSDNKSANNENTAIVKPEDKVAIQNIYEKIHVMEMVDLTEVAIIALADWQIFTKEILTLVEEGNGQRVLDSLSAASKLRNICQPIIILCLLVLTKQTADKGLVANAYSAVSKICFSSKLFFLFLQMNKIYTKASKKKGWGRGLRRAVRNWYLHWEPQMLAIEVIRYPSAYTWSHRDIIKLAHLKLKDLPTGTQIVLNYIFAGLEKTKIIFKEEPNAAEYLSMLELLHIEKKNAICVDKSVGRGKFIFNKFGLITLADFPSQIINEAKILEFILSNGTPSLVIQALSNTNLFKVSNCNKDMSSLLLSIIQKEDFVQDADALDILIAYNTCRRRAVELLSETEDKPKSKWMKNAKPTVEKSAKVAVPKIPKEISISIIEALGTLLVKSTELQSKTEKKAVIFIDTTPSLKNYISLSENHTSSKPIKGIQAISYIVLSLASNNRFDVVFPVFFSGTGLEKPSMPIPCPFHFIQTKLKNIAISTIKVKEGLNYACMHKLDTCIMLCYKITEEVASVAQQSITDLKTNDPSQHIRLIVCGICSLDGETDAMPVTMDCHPDLLLICGFNRYTLQTISAFHERVF